MMIFRSSRRLGMATLVLLLTLALPHATLAGGWSVVTLDSVPAQMQAGTPFTIGFMVR